VLKIKLKAKPSLVLEDYMDAMVKYKNDAKLADKKVRLDVIKAYNDDPSIDENGLNNVKLLAKAKYAPDHEPIKRQMKAMLRYGKLPLRDLSSDALCDEKKYTKAPITRVIIKESLDNYNTIHKFHSHLAKAVIEDTGVYKPAILEDLDSEFLRGSDVDLYREAMIQIENEPDIHDEETLSNQIDSLDNPDDITRCANGMYNAYKDYMRRYKEHQRNMDNLIVEECNKK